MWRHKAVLLLGLSSEERAFKHREMAFIKEETEDFSIEEVFSVKQEDFVEQTDLTAFKVENEELNEMEEGSVRTHRKMAFIKGETEDFRIEDVFSVKQEDFEEQIDLTALKDENEEQNEMEEKDQFFWVDGAHPTG
ncbi:hypothetical protein QQF64_036287 [Cirrhinus molitorella]|uniref:Uncharacterized protein n=1 Tax=Cirrhinus molitorella TaxID=172907 RepID=A0ABR3NIB8_9TELE